ncbi:hypothetical protein, conserved [Trypanosoma brucei gambiense DAL972]|uniref:YEATS domain-containing protein n=1 Tax=Trypanosoma brucei gambiense (strain MHOM/CI/86/DAL972) TaxID=679716 RepID=D0A4W8_TRYB9|nr:hypothetical protein, conserved [Trypanosoma brucei gambiense DAL972]CBH16312.1 hypothetical protein, conserved [Trypanosoma brucei gambiense DAL972]|eukprot:XP_011778576.1 hypothetical protein, conserved [Trypanosoma brucei gambiense DAL972]
MQATSKSTGSSVSITGEHEYVVYTGATLIPFCVGSVAFPLTLCRASSSAVAASSQAHALSSASRGNAKQKRSGKGSGQQETSRDEDTGDNVHDYCAGISRCTHVRYIYFRDGSVASQDLSYRHQLFMKADGVKRSEMLDGKESNQVYSASPLYALVDRVVFTLPNGFPERRREVTHPPFFIVDDTWAEHLVEVEVHFHPWLGIAPFTASHMVLLNQRVDVTPQLLSSTQGQCKPPSTVILSPDEEERLAGVGSSSLIGTKRSRVPECGVVLPEETSAVRMDLSNSVYSPDMVILGEPGFRERLVDLVGAPVVAERRDAMRIFHPTLDVVRYLAAVRAMPQPELMAPPRICLLPWYQQSVQPLATQHTEKKCEKSERCDRHGTRSRSVMNDDNICDDSDHEIDVGSLPPWCFPFEVIIHACESRRQSGAVDAMRAVLAELKKEQLELREGIEQNIAAATANAEELRDVIKHMSQRCAALQTSWKR